MSADEAVTTPEVAPEAREGDQEKPLGPYQRTDEELVKQINEWLRESSKGHSKRRKEREREWAALANDQWEEKDIQRMLGEKRATLTLNYLQTTIAAVEGEERSNRQEIKFYGTEQGDDPAAHGMNQLLKWVFDQCGGEFALSQQFKGQISVGEGWVVPEVDFFDDAEGQIKVVHVDEDEMYDDPLSVDPVGRDSRFLCRARMMVEDEIEARWPGKVKDLREHCAAEGIGPETDGKGFRDIYLTPNNVQSPKVFSATTKQWMVVETWWPQIEPGVVVVNDRGELEELKPDEFEQRKAQRLQEQRAYIAQAMAGQLPLTQDPATGAMVRPPMPRPLQSKERPIRCFYQAFTVGDVLLEKRPSPLQRKLRRFPYVPARAMFDKKNKEWFGLLKLLMDVQRQTNVEESAIIQLIQMLPKSSWMGPKGSFHNKAEWEQKIAQPGKMLEYNASRGKPEQIETPTIPRHLVELAQSRRQQMREISGVNIELTGVRQGGDAGVVMEMRKKAAATVLAPLFDCFRQAKLELGHVLLAYIQEYIPVNRRVRVLGEQGAGYVTMTEDMKLGRFDLKVEETNATINDRITTLTVMQTTLPEWIKAGVPVPPEFVDLLPMPPHIRDAFKRQVAWAQAINGMAPPPGWQPGMPIPLPAPAGAQPPAEGEAPPAQ